MTPEHAALIDRCRAALPELAVEPEGFLRYVHSHGHHRLDDLHEEDLYLAFACLTGLSNALARFEQRYGEDLHRTLCRLDKRVHEDAAQILRQRLFVGGASSQPKIASYSGRGPLRRWLRVVAGRILLELVAKHEPLADDWEVAELPVAGDDPEHAYLKARYRTEYKQAFEAALAALPDRPRTILAQYHVDGLTIDQLGALYGVHRVTASRWVNKAEDQLRQGVVDWLDRRFGLSPLELRSLTRLVRSNLSLSLTRVMSPT